MRRAFLIALIAMASTDVAMAQTTVPPGADHPGAACPPGAGRNAPAIGKDSDKPLSDQLAASGGIICPPAGVDPQMHQPPPQDGAIQVIPPPGSPGGTPNVQPK